MCSTIKLLLLRLIPISALSLSLAAIIKGQGANLLETRGRDVLSDRAIEVS